jgi:hypothetical protein
VEVRAEPAFPWTDGIGKVLLLLVIHGVRLGAGPTPDARTALLTGAEGRTVSRALSGAAIPSRTRRRGQLASLPPLVSPDDVPQRPQWSTALSSPR